jgi:mannose-6-phosphate isomerase-like protein (cupin superfamily)
MDNKITTDFGPHPFVVDINRATLGNDTYMTTLWTGEHMQLVMISIPVGDSLGLELYQAIDVIIRLEQGSGVALMGNASNNLYFQQLVFEDDTIFVPANTWHNVVNTGNVPIKLTAIYSTPQHPWGTVETTTPSPQSN